MKEIVHMWRELHVGYVSTYMNVKVWADRILDTRTFNYTFRCSFSLIKSHVAGAIQADRTDFKLLVYT